MITETKMDLKYEETQFEDAREELAQLRQWVAREAEAGTAFDEVERHLFWKILEIARHEIGRFLALTGPTDVSVALYGRSVALSGCSVALSGCSVALSGCSVALSGRSVALSGCSVAVYGCSVALYGRSVAVPGGAGNLSGRTAELPGRLGGVPLMERTGMRWKVPGAQAMLQLRVIRTHGDWPAFQEYRIKQEILRLYPHANATENILWPIAA